MKKDFVYFFKHNNINAIKIGKTSGDSVLDRFNSFRTYAPFGAEIVGFFETDNGHRDEKELHQLFKNHRLEGEFFDISVDMVRNIVYKKNKSYHKALSIFNEWIANSENDSSKLISLMDKAKVTEFDQSNILSKSIIQYIKNNFEVNQWYQFKESYNNLVNSDHNNECSKVAFKKNLEYFANTNDCDLVTKRVGTDKNSHYFKICNRL